MDFFNEFSIFFSCRLGIQPLDLEAEKGKGSREKCLGYLCSFEARKEIYEFDAQVNICLTDISVSIISLWKVSYLF